jgi:hypothetical protein
MATRLRNQFSKEINNPFYSHSRYLIAPGLRPLPINGNPFAIPCDKIQKILHGISGHGMSRLDRQVPDINPFYH